jgi:hypothetical protein
MENIKGNALSLEDIFMFIMGINLVEKGSTQIAIL